ncbi:MAG: DMT family transporter [Candidatus Saccharibacteria bacterium]|nr:DMT family transporter [Moraxellaceae bacterium]
MPLVSPPHQIGRGLALLALSACLFALMGVLIRLASYSVDNASVVFFRNLTGLIILLPIMLFKGSSFIKTDKIWMHSWRAIIGLMAMYGFFYAIAHLKLSNAMVFTYSSPIFIPLVAWLFLKERMNTLMWISAFIGLVGVVLVAKPNQGFFNLLSLIGIVSSFFAAMAFVTVRALTTTEPVIRIVFYFCLIGSLLSSIPMFWHWRVYTAHEMLLLGGAGLLATVSQLCLSKAYSYAPAGKIGPANYLAIIFAGIFAALIWQEYPDSTSVIGMALILVALFLCMPRTKEMGTIE